MTLTLRDPKEIEMAKELASLRGVSEVDAVTAALAVALEREKEWAQRRARIAAISERALAQAGPGGHDMTKDEIDALWGH
jgi:antitoxin VapB